MLTTKKKSWFFVSSIIVFKFCTDNAHPYCLHLGWTTSTTHLYQYTVSLPIAFIDLFIWTLYPQCGARTHCPEIKRHTLHWLIQPGTPTITFRRCVYVIVCSFSLLRRIWLNDYTTDLFIFLFAPWGTHTCRYQRALPALRPLELPGLCA